MSYLRVDSPTPSHGVWKNAQSESLKGRPDVMRISSIILHNPEHVSISQPTSGSSPVSGVSQDADAIKQHGSVSTPGFILPSYSKPTALEKSYLPQEKQLLCHLKQTIASWRMIAEEYNRQMPANRQRTAAALECQWRVILRDACVFGYYNPSAGIGVPGYWIMKSDPNP